MKTKEEYIEALERMKESYYNFDNCMSAMNKLKEDISLITELVNEHFEEKQETNLEHYYEDLLKIGSGSFGVTDGKVKQCYNMSCSQCDIKRINNSGYCRINAIKWLASPYKKTACKLTKFEYDLLNAYKNSGMRQCISNYGTLLEMYGKGHFKGIDTSTPIHEILDNCEVVG